jgi:hypothetical protein
MTNGNGDTLSAMAYRRKVLQTTNSGTFVSFRVPTHSQTALVLERVTFDNVGSQGSIAVFDQVHLSVKLSTLDAASGGTRTLLFNMPWVVMSGAAAGTALSFNPPNGGKIDPAVRLPPNDDPCWVTLSTVGNAFGDTMVCVMQGWEIPTADLATFPMPRYEAVV